MAKNHRRNQASTESTRGHSVTATSPTLKGLVRLTSPLDIKHTTPDLRVVEDRRTYPHEIRDTQFRDVRGAPAQISRRPASSRFHQVRGLLPPMHSRFVHPERVPVCVRREVRRRVLHALHRSGRGYRRPRWTAKSFIRCK